MLIDFAQQTMHTTLLKAHHVTCESRSTRVLWVVMDPAGWIPWDGSHGTDPERWIPRDRSHGTDPTKAIHGNRTTPAPPAATPFTAMPFTRSTPCCAGLTCHLHASLVVPAGFPTYAIGVTALELGSAATCANALWCGLSIHHLCLRKCLPPNAHTAAHPESIGLCANAHTTAHATAHTTAHTTGNANAHITTYATDRAHSHPHERARQRDRPSTPTPPTAPTPTHTNAHANATAHQRPRQRAHGRVRICFLISPLSPRHSHLVRPQSFSTLLMLVVMTVSNTVAVAATWEWHTVRQLEPN